MIEGREVRRPAVPAEDMMQAFAYRHLVPAQELMVAVLQRGGAAAPVRLLERGPVKLSAGGTASVRFAAPNAPFLRQVKLELNEPPEGISIRNVSLSPEGVTVLLAADAAKTKPGLKGNLIINAFTERVPPAAKAKPSGQKQRQSLCGRCRPCRSRSSGRVRTVTNLNPTLGALHRYTETAGAEIGFNVRIV